MRMETSGRGSYDVNVDESLFLPYICNLDHQVPMRKLLLLFMITLTLSVAAQHQHLSGNNFNISYLTMENGLLHDFIDDIYQDSRGFIWISTSSGLSRYDGFSFIHYHMGTSPLSLKGNTVHKTLEDNHNRLWIACPLLIKIKHTPDFLPLCVLFIDVPNK